MSKQHRENPIIRQSRNWSYRIVHDKKRGIVDYWYYYKNKKAKKVIITTKKGRKFGAYTLIQKDLELVARWLSRLQIKYEKYGKTDANLDASTHSNAKEAESMDTMLSYWIAALTTYGKCFTQAKGRRTTLSKKVFDPESKHIEIHVKVMDSRHQFAAHAGVGQYESTEPPFAVFAPPDRQGSLAFQIRCEVIKAKLWPREEIEEFERLVEYVHAYVTQEAAKIADSIKRDLEVKGLDFWAKKAT